MRRRRRSRKERWNRIRTPAAIIITNTPKARAAIIMRADTNPAMKTANAAAARANAAAAATGAATAHAKGIDR